jgi:hypothetical protein
MTTSKIIKVVTALCGAALVAAICLPTLAPAKGSTGHNPGSATPATRIA